MLSNNTNINNIHIPPQILANRWKQAPECEMEKQDTARLFAIMSDEAEEMEQRKAAEKIIRAR